MVGWDAGGIVSAQREEALDWSRTTWTPTGPGANGHDSCQEDLSRKLSEHGQSIAESCDCQAVGFGGISGAKFMHTVSGNRLFRLPPARARPRSPFSGLPSPSLQCSSMFWKVDYFIHMGGCVGLVGGGRGGSRPATVCRNWYTYPRLWCDAGQL